MLKGFVLNGVILLFLLLVINFPINAMEYNGVITSLDIATYAQGTNAAYYGFIDRVGRLGQIIRPSIFDENGKVVVEGDHILDMDNTFFIEQVVGSKEALTDSIVQYQLAKINCKRYAFLAKTRSSSEEDYEDALNQVYTTYENMSLAIANLSMNQGYLESATNIAPFEGIVTNVYLVDGLACWQNAIEVTQLNPIGVEVKMNREDARKIGMDTPITVYPINSSTPYGVFNGNSILTDDGIMFQLANFPSLNKTDPIPDNGIDVYRNSMPVIDFYIDGSKDTLAVHKDSLSKDSQGSYVWKAVGQKTMQVDRGVDPEFKIQKVYVKPSDLYRSVFGYDGYIALDNPGTLELDDIVLLNPSKSLKNGQEVYNPDERYIFMPGDNVRVVIGNDEKGGKSYE